MLPQYKLVVVSFFAILVASVLISLYLRFARKKNYVWIVFILSLPPLVSIFRPGSYESGDLSLNVYKTMALFASLKDGVFPANWAGSLNATYGYPMFNFAYPLPYYVASFFHFVGFPFLDSVKLVLALSFIFSGIAMYYFLKNLLTPFAAFVGAIFYLYAPYHLIDMHFRVDIGETTAFVFIPLLFLFGTKLIQKYSPFTMIFLAFSLCGLLLSHQAVSLMTLPFWGCYMLLVCILNKRSWKEVLPSIAATILGFALAAFYVIPVILELPYTLQPTLQAITFPALQEFFYAPWRYGLLFQGHQGELSFLIGYAQLIALLLALLLVWKATLKKPHKYLLFYTLISFFVVFFMMQSFSQPLWDILPLIKNFQFSYRLLSLEMFFTGVLAGLLAIYLPKKYIFFLLFIAVFSTILNWGNRRNMPELTDPYFARNLPYSTYEGEGLTPAAPKWIDPAHPWFKTPPKQHLEIVSGDGSVRELSRTTDTHIYTISAKTPLHLAEHTLYFPGWHVLLKDTSLPLDISQEKGKQGIMLFSVPKGTYTISIVYIPTYIRIVSQTVTILAIIICIALASTGYKRYSLSKRVHFEHKK